MAKPFGHETTDANIRPIVLTGVALAMVAAIVLGISIGLFRFFVARPAPAPPNPMASANDLLPPLEAALALADGLDGEAPEAPWLRPRDTHGQVKPLVGKRDSLGVLQVDSRVEHAEIPAGRHRNIGRVRGRPSRPG